MGTEPAGAGPRGAARGGVNGPALPVQRGREGPLSIDEKQIVALATELISEVTSKMTRGDKARQVASLDVQQTLAMAHGRHSFAGAPSLVMLASPSRYRLTLAAPRDPI